MICGCGCEFDFFGKYFVVLWIFFLELGKRGVGGICVCELCELFGR